MSVRHYLSKHERFSEKNGLSGVVMKITNRPAEYGMICTKGSTRMMTQRVGVLTATPAWAWRCSMS
jgi:hypothetical protein